MNVLFLAHRLPYAPNRGDRVRAFHLLRDVGQWANVHLVSLTHDAEEESQTGVLTDVVASVTTVRVTGIRNALRAVAALPTRKPTTHSMLNGRGLEETIDSVARRHKPDVILSYCTGVAPLALMPSLRGIPLVLDMVDVDSEKWAGLASASRPPLSWIYGRENRLLKHFEREISERAELTFVVTEKEKRTLQQIAPAARIEVVPNGVDAARLHPSASKATSDPTVVFCGVMNYAPNVEGVLWLVREVWPRVRHRVPDARLEIVGSHPTRAVRNLANPGLGVHVTGPVPDVRPHLWAAAVSVAPLLTARGVQNKVLEAVAAGLPVVVTPVVHEGLPRSVQTACTTAADPHEFAEAIVALLKRSPQERRALALSAGVDRLSWERSLAPVRTLVTEIVAQRG